MKCEKVWVLKPTKSNIFYFFPHTIFLKCICILAMPLSYYIDVSKWDIQRIFFKIYYHVLTSHPFKKVSSFMI